MSQQVRALCPSLSFYFQYTYSGSPHRAHYALGWLSYDCSDKSKFWYGELETLKVNQSHGPKGVLSIASETGQVRNPLLAIKIMCSVDKDPMYRTIALSKIDSSN